MPSKYGMPIPSHTAKPQQSDSHHVENTEKRILKKIYGNWQYSASDRLFNDQKHRRIMTQRSNRLPARSASLPHRENTHNIHPIQCAVAQKDRNHGKQNEYSDGYGLLSFIRFLRTVCV